MQASADATTGIVVNLRLGPRRDSAQESGCAPGRVSRRRADSKLTLGDPRNGGSSQLSERERD
jgi:hypothetical protein